MTSTGNWFYNDYNEAGSTIELNMNYETNRHLYLII